MLCVEVSPEGVVRVPAAQPADITTCSMVLGSSEDFVHPWNLTTAEGGAVATAVLGVWAVGYVTRLIIRALFIGDDSNEST